MLYYNRNRGLRSGSQYFGNSRSQTDRRRSGTVTETRIAVSQVAQPHVQVHRSQDSRLQSESIRIRPGWIALLFAFCDRSVFCLKEGMELKRKKRKGINYTAMKCPYCGGSVTYRSADGIYRENPRGVMLYVCSRYPSCDAYVRVHEGTTIPVGSLANGELRALRREAHQWFDRLYREGIMTKDDAYEWLSELISAPRSQAHIGFLGEYRCRQVIAESRKLVERKQRFF